MRETYSQRWSTAERAHRCRHRSVSWRAAHPLKAWDSIGLAPHVALHTCTSHTLRWGHVSARLRRVYMRFCAAGERCSPVTTLHAPCRHARLTAHAQPGLCAVIHTARFSRSPFSKDTRTPIGDESAPSCDLRLHVNCCVYAPNTSINDKPGARAFRSLQEPAV